MANVLAHPMLVLSAGAEGASLSCLLFLGDHLRRKRLKPLGLGLLMPLVEHGDTGFHYCCYYGHVGSPPGPSLLSGAEMARALLVLS